MTIEEKIKEMLYNCGLFEKQCEEIMERVKSQIEAMTHGNDNRWNDSVESYPDIVLKQLWIQTKHITLKYIDETCPEAWNRSLFT